MGNIETRNTPPGQERNEEMIRKFFSLARQRDYESGNIILKTTTGELAWRISVMNNRMILLDSLVYNDTMKNMKGWILESDAAKVYIEGDMQPTGKYTIELYEEDIGNERQPNFVLKAVIHVKDDGDQRLFGQYDAM